MSKGRNSWQITLRLPDNIRAELNRRAEKRDESVAQYLQNQILRSARTTNPTSDVDTSVSFHESSPSARTTKPSKQELQAMIDEKQGHKTEVQPNVPWYVRGKHKQGDKVRMRDAAGRVQVVTVPELDAEGTPIW